MKKLILLSIATLILFSPINVTAQENGKETGLKAAFIREGHLWLYHESETTQLTDDLYVSRPIWSHDGTWLAFEANSTIESEQQEGLNDIWLHHLPTNKQFKLSIPGKDIYWSPTKNELAFISGASLSLVQCTSDGPVIYPLTDGVSSFTWASNGKSMVVTAAAAIFPDGWSHPRIYNATWKKGKKEEEIEVSVSSIFTVPSPVKLEDISVLSIALRHLKWSPDERWISMTVTPTASWSMDQNIVGIFAVENKVFIPLGEILDNPSWIQWAPTKPIVASIQGSGRTTVGINNKKLVVQTVMPTQTKTYTPKGYADIDFTWLDDEKIVVARGKETNKPSEFFQSTLFVVNTKTDEQVQIIPNEDRKADSAPILLHRANKISWMRTSDQKTSIWVSNPDGSDAKMILEHVDVIEWYNPKK
ncbi:hypothetical protein [Sutcliffiella cohnii]|uniref:TolB family protein n=1 Tax=Sutcliffiella cohnii TaxID=33932 RepID=UPI002E1AA52B|nr:hypothetical protein [Sutcliffiella cohnii]